MSAFACIYIYMCLHIHVFQDSYMCHDTPYRQDRIGYQHHTAPRSTTQHHAAPHYTTRFHTAPHCTTQLHTAPHCTTLQHTAPHCTTLHHTATHSKTLQHTVRLELIGAAIHSIFKFPKDLRRTARRRNNIVLFRHRQPQQVPAIRTPIICQNASFWRQIIRIIIPHDGRLCRPWVLLQ